MQNLGFKNVLGVKNGATVQCLNSSTPGGPGTIYTITIDQNGNWIGSTFEGYNNYGLYAQYDSFDGVNYNSACPAVSDPGSVIQSYGRIISIQTNGTGIYEFQPMLVSLGMIAIVCAIIAVGIRKAQQGVRNLIEETSEDDAIEWYTGPDGREYYRLKPSIRRKLGYD